MRLSMAALCGATMTLIAACGTGGDRDKQPDDQQQAQPVDQQSGDAQRAQAAQEIPGATIVRIEVDEQGNPVGNPEMRVAQGATELATPEAAEAAFAGGAAPARLTNTVDELDQADAGSTQSWTSWNAYGYTNDYKTPTQNCQTQGYATGCNGSYSPPANTYTPPTTYTPPVYTPPATYTPPTTYTPPAYTPPAYTPPAYTPPAYTPPTTYTPPTDTYTPPTYTPTYTTYTPDTYNQNNQNNQYNQSNCYGVSYGCSNYHNFWYTTYKPQLQYKSYRWDYGYNRPSHYKKNNSVYYCYSAKRTY